MPESRLIPEQRVIETLEAGGCSWRDYFLFGEAESASVCRFVAGSGLMTLLIEDGNLARACKGFLATRGAERLATFEDVKSRFGWDGQFRMPKRNETGS
jgi:hypothetical protein